MTKKIIVGPFSLLSSPVLFVCQEISASDWSVEILLIEKSLKIEEHKNK